MDFMRVINNKKYMIIHSDCKPFYSKKVAERIRELYYKNGKQQVLAGMRRNRKRNTLLVGRQMVQAL